MSVLDTIPYENNYEKYNRSTNKTLNRSLNFSRKNCNTEQKLIDDEKIKNVNISEFNYNQIIIKNISTEDKRLYVFIKSISYLQLIDFVF